MAPPFDADGAPATPVELQRYSSAAAPTRVDTGHLRDRERLLRSLELVGRRPSDVDAVVLTHGPGRPVLIHAPGHTSGHCCLHLPLVADVVVPGHDPAFRGAPGRAFELALAHR